MNRTKNISKTVIREALAICGGLYSRNATTSKGYAFCPDSKGKTIDYGEFVFTDDCLNGNVGFICTRDFDLTGCSVGNRLFKAGNLYDMNSGESIPLNQLS